MLHGWPRWWAWTFASLVHFDDFMRHYLTLKSSGAIPNVRAVYEAFKGHARSPEVAAAGVDALVADIHTYGDYYCAMALDKEPTKDLARAFRDLEALRCLQGRDKLRGLGAPTEPFAPLAQHALS